uniref:ead/Ea22-like family protein n=1 Tax=Shigella boydii TaxID=621 RepID=UPI000A47D50C
PRDLKVNETNAEYLVRKFAEAEAKCAALAAENAVIKSAIPEPRDIEDDNDNMDDVSLAEDFGFNHAIERMRRRIPETPATDAFLAEVRASAIPDEATERDLFEEWVMEKIFISKTTLEGLRTDDGYRNSTLSGTDYNGMWSQWKAIRAAQLRQEAAQ